MYVKMKLGGINDRTRWYIFWGAAMIKSGIHTQTFGVKKSKIPYLLSST